MSASNNWLEEIAALRATGSFEKAIEFLQQILALRSSDPVVHYQIGAYVALGSNRLGETFE